MVFGPHLMLDLRGCDRERLADMKLAYKILDELPDELGMHKVMPPYVIPYKGSDAPDKFDRGGVSGVVIIAESHIGIHTFIDQEYAFVDIFSCKEFDQDEAIRYLVGAYGAKNYERIFAMRGRDFPKNLPRSVQLLKAQRYVKAKKMDGQ